MKRHIKYILRRWKMDDVMKIISLSMGLTVALVLFSKVVFEMSYDRSYPDADRIYRIQRKMYKNDNTGYEGPRINAPLPDALKDNIKEIQNAVLIFSAPAEDFLVNEDKIFKEKILTVDTGFFDMFGIRLTEGNKDRLSIEANVFLSQPAARRLFGVESPVGKTLLM